MLSNVDDNNTIRVLWLIDSLTMGGAETLTATMAGSVASGNIELHVACLKSIEDNPVESRLKKMGAIVTNLHARNLRDLKAFTRLKHLVRDTRAQIIHAHLTYACIWGSILSKLTGVPMIGSIHVLPEAHPPWSRPGIRQRLQVLLLNRYAKAIVTVSAAVRDEWGAQAGLNRSKVSVVHNGINLKSIAVPEPASTRARVHEELGVPQDALVAITVSVLRPGKGIEVLLDAASKLASKYNDIRFLMVGDGPLRESLEDQCETMGLHGRVLWAGYLEEVAPILAAADMFVFPSLYDALPTVLMEAMAAGLPVVATNTGGIPEIIEHGVTGLLTQPGNPEALVEAVSSLARAPDQRRMLATAARDKAQGYFSDSAWMRRLRDVYTGVLYGTSTITGGA